MKLAAHKTKIVCTVGPACEAPRTLARMLRAGMDIARLNFSHGDFAWHKAMVGRLRRAARLAGKGVTIMADLPGPKIRIGELAEEPLELKRGDAFTLTTDETLGDRRGASVNFPLLPSLVKRGSTLFLNDGLIRLEVLRVEGRLVRCRVRSGGELRSHKGVNLPGIRLGIGALTRRGRDCLKFALENGVDAVAQSFVESAADVDAVRRAAAGLGKRPFIIAKIERAGALARIDEILTAADGIMIARGDLGVETPIERMAVVQKQLTARANQLGKPVITATQMLESMVENARPTRAEATDVANAILDGTDCVMLSEESAMGKHPVEAVEMLARIAAATEPHRPGTRIPEHPAGTGEGVDARLVDLISRDVQHAAARLAPAAVVVPTVTGRTARMVSRFKLPVWIAAVSPDAATCSGLRFSYGVSPVLGPKRPRDWNAFARRWTRGAGLAPGLALLTEGPSRANPKANHRLEIIELRPGGGRRAAMPPRAAPAEDRP
jgi:pyruvate kinase